MEMTLQQYIDNPLGKRNAVFAQRDMYKTLYTEKWDNVYLREAGRINYKLYRDKKHDRYIAHIKVPSETVNHFYYDVVFLFYSTDAGQSTSSTLEKYYVKFFSNDPAFVFTYLRVFIKNDMFFEDLKSKASKIARTKDPKVTNPYEVPGYSKILYFGYLFLKQRNLLNKGNFNSIAVDYNPKDLLANVEDTDTKIDQRQEEGKKVEAQKAREKREENRARNPISRFSPPGVQQTGNVQITRRSSISPTIKKTGITKLVGTSKKIAKKKKI